MVKTFAVGYNVFDDSIELLESSIRSIRGSVDKVYVVYQTISNFGNPATEPLETILQDLIDKKLVDEIYHYKPKVNLGGYYNEITKRNIGLFMAEGDSMDYFMTMDSDEFYLKDELEKIKQKYIDEDLDSSYCQMLTYYKTSEFIREPPEEYYVSLFYKIRGGIKFEMGYPTSVLVDPTRRQESGKYSVLSREEIQMHYVSHVRNNNLEDNAVTFIIPTINRDTLNRSINSILNQTNKNWFCKVVFDDVEPIFFNDDRIESIKIEKLGVIHDGHGQAGLVRNFGIDLVKTNWIAFLDDDDTINDNYVEILLSQYLDKDFVIFKMKYENGFTLPQGNNLSFGNVGISFAYKKYLNMKFESNKNSEDFDLIQKLKNKTDNYIVSDYIMYNVRH